MRNIVFSCFISVLCHALLILGATRIENHNKKLRYAKKARTNSFSLSIQLNKEKLYKNHKNKNKNKNKNKKKVKKYKKVKSSFSKKESKEDLGEQSSIAKYLESIRNLVISSQVKTRLVKRLKLEGSVKLAFTIKRPNKIIGLKLVKSSEFSAIDQSALLTIKSIKAVPPIPSEISLSEVPVLFTIRYKNEN